MNSQKVKADSTKSTSELREALGVDKSKVVHHREPVRKLKKLVKWLPHELNDNQNDHRKYL